MTRSLARPVSWILPFLLFSAPATSIGQGKDAATRDFPIGVRVSLSAQAAKTLTARKETILVAATYGGAPTKAAIARKVPLDEEGKVDLGEEKFELRKLADVRLTAAKMPASQLQYVKDGGIHIRINVFSGRRSSKNNLLDCSIFDGDARTVAHKSIPIRCKLIGER